VTPERAKLEYQLARECPRHPGQVHANGDMATWSEDQWNRSLIGWRRSAVVHTGCVPEDRVTDKFTHSYTGCPCDRLPREPFPCDVCAKPISYGQSAAVLTFFKEAP
jgi:hypothetical protein